MEFTRNQKITYIVVALCIVGLVVWNVTADRPSIGGGFRPTLFGTSSNENVQGNGDGNAPSGNVDVTSPTIELTPEYDESYSFAPYPRPDLTRPLLYTPTTPSASKEKAEATLASLKKTLTEQPGYFPGWIDLGLLRHSYNDKVGAKEAWEYAKILRPKSSLPYGNLANLYAYDLKDPEKAKLNYSEAMRLDPKMAYLYGQAYEYYLNILKDEDLAKNVLIQATSNLTPDQAAPFKEELKKYQ